MRAITTTILLAALVLAGCAPSLRMHAVDNVSRRTLRIEGVAVELKKALEVQPSSDVTPDVVVVLPISPAVIVKALTAILYEAQEMKGWQGALRKDVGEVPPKKQLELDTPKEQDTNFEYIVKSGAKASKRARRKQLWLSLLSLPQKILAWTVKTIWKIIPWWVKLPVLLAFVMWAGGTILIYWTKIRAARAAAQAEATVARLKGYVEAETFAAAIDAELNPDFARVHARQKRVAAKRTKRNGAR